MGPETAEILLISTNVVWTVELVLYVPRNIPLKFGYNHCGNSREIADMDKNRQGKCCLDKRHLTAGIGTRCSQ